MKLHLQNQYYTIANATCHTVNVGRASMKVVDRETFEKAAPDHRCKRCEKTLKKSKAR